MASAADLRSLRENINEADESVYSDDYLDAMLDANGSVEAAAAAIWRLKAAAFSEAFDQGEAGANAKLSDLLKNALEMATHYEGIAGVGVPEKQRAKVHTIKRST
jgi:hypothetical protein